MNGSANRATCGKDSYRKLDCALGTVGRDVEEDGSCRVRWTLNFQPARLEPLLKGMIANRAGTGDWIGNLGLRELEISSVVVGRSRVIAIRRHIL